MFVVSLRFGKKRRKIFFSVITVALLTALLLTLSATFNLQKNEEIAEYAGVDAYKKIIVIDAGHGGEDSGAVGVNGVYEKDLNLQIANAVGDLLEKEGYLIVYTRSEDKLLYGSDENVKGLRKISDLKNRCKIAESYPDSVFVSIHMNSFGDEKYSGLQVYYSSNSEGSERLANSVQESVRDRVQQENKRKIKKGEGIYLLENIKNDAVLIECGFITNEEECKKLSEKEYQNALSFSIVCGIIEYVESK